MEHRYTWNFTVRLTIKVLQSGVLLHVVSLMFVLIAKLFGHTFFVQLQLDHLKKYDISKWQCFSPQLIV